MIKALIIDGERSGRTVLQHMLEQFCHNVEVTAVAGDVEMGEKLLKQNHPDVVFLDADTSKSTSSSLLDLIRKKEINVVVVTVDEFYQSVAAQKRGVSILHKPYAPKELRAILEKIEEQNI